MSFVNLLNYFSIGTCIFKCLWQLTIIHEWPFPVSLFHARVWIMCGIFGELFRRPALTSCDEHFPKLMYFFVFFNAGMIRKIAQKNAPYIKWSLHVLSEHCIQVVIWSKCIRMRMEDHEPSNFANRIKYWRYRRLYICSQIIFMTIPDRFSCEFNVLTIKYKYS